MKLITLLSLTDELNKHLENFRSWVVDNYANPVVWVGMFVVGILVFEFTYSALQKEK